MSGNSRSSYPNRGRGDRPRGRRGRGGRQSGSGNVDIPEVQSGTTNARGRGSSRLRGPHRRSDSQMSRSSATSGADKIKLVSKAIYDIRPGDVIYAETPGLKEMNERINWIYGSTSTDKHDQIVLTKDEASQEVVTVMLTTVGRVGENDNEHDLWDRWNLIKLPYSKTELGKGLRNLAGVEPTAPRREDIKNYDQPKYMIKYATDTESRYSGPIQHWAHVAHGFRIKPSPEEGHTYAVRNGMKFSLESVKNVIQDVIKREYDENVKAILSEPLKGDDSVSLDMYVKPKKKGRSERDSESAAETEPLEEPASGRAPAAIGSGPHKRMSWAKVTEEGHKASQASEKPPSLPSRAKGRDPGKGPAFVEPSAPPLHTVSWAKVTEEGHKASQASEKPPSLPSRAKDRNNQDKGPTFVIPRAPPPRSMSWAKVVENAEDKPTVKK